MRTLSIQPHISRVLLRSVSTSYQSRLFISRPASKTAHLPSLHFSTKLNFIFQKETKNTNQAQHISMTVSSSDTKSPPQAEVVFYPSASAPPTNFVPTAHATIVDNVTASAPPSVGGKTKVTKTTYTIPADIAATTPPQTQVIPPRAKPGGVWMSQHYRGPITGGATCAGVLLFFVPGLLMLCFPMDKRYVYLEPGPNGRLLSGSGKRIKGGRNPKVLPPGYGPYGMNA